MSVIGGEVVAARDGATLEVRCPSDGHVFTEIARGREADVDRAVAAARAALRGEWGRHTAVERGRLLLRLGERILVEHEALAQLESRDTGKPLAQGRADVTAAARYFEYYGAAADKVHGTTVPYLDGHTVAVLREPHGVTGHIIPWNYPAQMFGRTLAPALAMGNATVLKPGEDASLTPLRLAELALEAGFPAGAINVVTGLGREAGVALAAHPGVDFLSFTGSPEVGTLVQSAAARHHAGCTLELGGKSPQIVFDDADLDAALPVVVRGIIQNGGQTCSAGSRVLLQRGIYEEAVAELASRFAALRVGPHDQDPDCGALINARQRRRVLDYVEDGVASGVPVLARTEPPADLPPDGFYVMPTLFGPAPRDHRLAHEELFGPVLVAMPFADEADAIDLANATAYGLVAGVWTRDGARQLRVAHALRAGQVFVNTYGAGAGIELPFGGVKRSGHGREKGFGALEELSVTKTVVLHHG